MFSKFGEGALVSRCSFAPRVLLVATHDPRCGSVEKGRVPTRQSRTYRTADIRRLHSLTPSECDPIFQRLPRLKPAMTYQCRRSLLSHCMIQEDQRDNQDPRF